jgi:hypothetical protein
MESLSIASGPRSLVTFISLDKVGGLEFMRLRFVLSLPRFVLHPFTSVIIAAVHAYLAYGHLAKLMGGEVLWVHIWKGFGASFGAYVFAALASRRSTESPQDAIPQKKDTKDSSSRPQPAHA